MRIAAALVLAGALSLCVLPVSAANSQQDKMKTCNADATKQQLKGDARKSFMKSCLGKEATTQKAGTQQQKMKTCNADATKQQLKGDARKSFMKTCLSAAPAAN